jgi:DNA-binding SARP family transcriptional activator
MSHLHFTVMGPLEFYNGRRWGALSALKWRVVLALLLMNANRVVTVDQVMDELRGTEMSATPR